MPRTRILQTGTRTLQTGILYRGGATGRWLVHRGVKRTEHARKGTTPGAWAISSFAASAKASHLIRRRPRAQRAPCLQTALADSFTLPSSGQAPQAIQRSADLNGAAGSPGPKSQSQISISNLRPQTSISRAPNLNLKSHSQI